MPNKSLEIVWEDCPAPQGGTDLTIKIDGPSPQGKQHYRDTELDKAWQAALDQLNQAKGRFKNLPYTGPTV